MNDLDILTRTLFGEAERNDIEDAHAIANVVMNRVSWKNWPNTAAAVCMQPWQFSCWNHTSDNAAHRARILAADGTDPWFRACMDVARRALAGDLPDITSGATHYYATYLKPPAWARGHEPVFDTGHGKYTHVFFNDIDTPPPSTAAQALDQARPLSQTGTIRGAKVAAGATVAAALAEVAQVAEPAATAAGAVKHLVSFGPLVLGLVALAGIGYMVWRRIEDRRAGAR